MTKTIKIIEGTVCGGRCVAPGEVVEVGRGDAMILVAMGRAKYVEPAVPVKETTAGVQGPPPKIEASPEAAQDPEPAPSPALKATARGRGRRR